MITSMDQIEAINSATIGEQRALFAQYSIKTWTPSYPSGCGPEEGAGPYWPCGGYVKVAMLATCGEDPRVWSHASPRRFGASWCAR